MEKQYRYQTKKISFAFLILLTSFLLTSCLDYVQAISYKDGKYTMYYKITVSKTLFALSGEDSDDYTDAFEQAFNDNSDESLSTKLPSNAKLKTVNTTNDIGYEISFSISPSTTDENEKSFLPKASGTKCYIPFLLGNEELDIASELGELADEDDEYAQLFLSSSKCRVLVSKKIIPKVETAYFEGRGGQNASIPIFDYGESYCAEIPFALLLEDRMYNFSRIVLIRGE